MPECAPGDVLIRVARVGICGSDLAIYGGRWSFQRPFVIGHEGYGRVEAVGSNVRDRPIGALVAVEPNIVCGQCALCLRGLSSLCQQKRSIGVGTDGLCAEFAVLPAAFTWPLPDTLSEDDAVCIEPLAVALAAIREGSPQAGDNVTVFGAGSQGLLLTLALAARGCAPHVVDPQPKRLELARALGARSVSAELPEGPASDCVFETSGTPVAIEAAIAAGGPGATIVLVGLGHEPVTLDAVRIVRQRLRIRGSIIYEHPRDFASTVRLVSDGTLHPGRVLGQSFALAQADDALRSAPMLSGKTWVAIQPAKEGS